MRIALVIHDGSPLTPAKDPQQGLRTAAVASLAQALARLGHRTTIFARKDSRGLPTSVILPDGVTIEHLVAGPQAPLADAELGGHIAEFADKLARRWARNQPDIAHAHGWTSGLAVLAAARGRDIRVVQSFHSLGLAERRHHLPGGEARIRVEACLARSADAVIAGSCAEAADLIQLGVQRKSVTIVPSGVETAQFCPEGPVASRNGHPRLLAVAPLAPGHGLAELLHVLAAVPGAELVIAGGPPRSQLRKDVMYRKLRQLAKQLGVDGRLVFTGQLGLAELPALLRSADLLVSAAAYEPRGAVTVAAMACGTPAAVCDAGGNSDAVLDQTTGVLVPPGRPDLLAAQVRRLLAAPLRLEAFGIAAADRATARYSFDRIARETAAAYQRCLPQSVAEAAVPADAAAQDESYAGLSLPPLEGMAAALA